MKKVIFIMFIIFFATLVLNNQIVYAADTQETEIDESFVEEAFKATGEFLGEELPEDNVGVITDSFLFFVKDAIQGINRVLIVALAGIGAIALSISGITYMRSIQDPKKAAEAKDMLNTTLRGLGFGFGAFLIWEIAMGVVKLIINTLAK